MSPVPHETMNDLPENVRSQVSDLLNNRLAEAIDLQTQAKQAHWNVKGPQFIALHKLFDEIDEAVEEYVDLLAERVVQLGGIAEGTARVVAERSELPEYPLTISTGEEHVCDVSQPREPDPHLRAERERVLARCRHGPAGLEHRHEAAQLVAHPKPIGHPAEPPGFFPRADDFALHHERAAGIGTEGHERLHLPHVLPAQRRRGLDAQVHERATLEAVPQV